MVAGIHGIGGRDAESNFRLVRTGFAGRSPGALDVLNEIARLVRLAGVCAGVGALVSLILIAIWKVGEAVGLVHIGDVVLGMSLVLWPAIVFTMALGAGLTTRDVILAYTLLIVVNALLYGFVGLAVGVLMRIVRTLAKRRTTVDLR